MFKRQGSFKTFICKLLHRTIIWIEKGNDANPSKNGEYNFLSYLRSKGLLNGHVFDVGAHEGKYSEQILQVLGPERRDLAIHLFEPSLKNYSLLQRKFPQRYIKTNNFGCSDRSESRSLYSNAAGSSLSSVYCRSTEVSGLDFTVTEECNFRRLDRYMLENDISKVAMLKIDVEGHEYAVLQGLGERLSPKIIACIQFEYGGTNLDSGIPLRSFYRLLRAKGYFVGKLNASSVEIREYHPYMENYAYANYVAVCPEVLGQ